VTKVSTLRRAAATLPLVFVALATAVAPTASSAPAHACVSANELWFRAADGTRLVGHRFGGKRPAGRTAVVLAHQSNGDVCEWAPYARRLAARGLFAFAFDFRGHGSSPGRQTYGRLGLDVTAAVRAVRSLGARKVVVVGASLGGIAGVVGAAGTRPALTGFVAVSAPAEIAGRLSALPSAARLRVPTLYLAAEGDQSPPYDFAADAQRLYDATATTEKRLQLVPGTLHGVALVAGSSDVRRLLEAFLRDPAGTVP
jgi:alpha-beta hydrolase superfamily lysophospholipase